LIVRNDFQLRFRLFGVPVRVHPTFWPLALAVGAHRAPQPLSALVWLATVMAVLLVGELAIALSLRALGYAPIVWLHWTGGETTVAQAKPRPASQLLAAYAGGPLAVLILAGALAGLSRVWPTATIHDAVLVATFWGLFSALPIRPFVGAKMLEVALTRPFRARAEAVSRAVSLLLALGALALIVGVAFSFSAFLLLMVCLWVNFSSLRQARLQRADARAAAELNAGYAALRDRDDARALEIAERLLRETRSLAWRGRARELQAWAHLLAGRLDAAESTLERMPPGTEPDPLLEGSLYLSHKEWRYAAVLLADALAKHENDDTAARLAHALVQDRRLDEALPLAARPFAGPKTLDQLVSALYYAGRLDEARALGEKWWALEHAPRLAFNLGCIDARSGRLDEACRWLDEAVAAGWRDLKLLDEDPDLAPLRKRPEFHQVRARLTSLGRVSG
jgi:hypothetical protein